MKRILAFIIGIALSSILFVQLGFHATVYGIFLLIFIILCNLFRLEVGITSNAVLVTHLLSQGTVNTAIILNEVYILIIGAGIGVLINLFIPKRVEKIKEKQRGIDSRMKEILYHLSEEIISVRSEEEVALFQNLDEELEVAVKLSKELLYNSFDSDIIYYNAYMEMRKNQSNILKDIHHHIHRLNDIPAQAYEISDLIKHLSASFHEYNNADGLLETLKKVIVNFKGQPLPATREEFENRAVLYQIMYDFQYFLTIKQSFSNSLSKRQKQIFWNQ